MLSVSLLHIVPTRLFALKHGATLVWGPEMVDKAILHAERVVDRQYERYMPELFILTIDFIQP